MLIETDSSFPHSQMPANSPSPESSRFRSYHYISLPENHLNNILLSRLESPKWNFSLRFPTKTLYKTLQSPMHANCYAHFIFLDFINRIILDEEYRSLSASLCISLHSYAVLFLQGPNNLHIDHLHYKILYNHSN
jgi:hypothetical protein